ncbi:MAG: hypothetical protein M1837_001338 [Sclerophora amabilis]|nr:MAG: hypothetical protein M1837_001338 [Sclerophora amabilis]
MGLFARIVVRQPPQSATATDQGPENAAEIADPEKATDLRIEDENNVRGDERGIAHHRTEPLLESRVVRAMDWRVPPLLAALYLLSFLDRSNVGGAGENSNARIAGMEEDLELEGDRYDWLLTIFYISYIMFEFWALMWKLVPPHLWAAIVVMAWGTIATLQGATTNWAGMMACRFFLGASEAAFAPGVPFLLSFFYLRHELGARIGIFLSAAPLANTFAGALAYGITSGHSKLANWRLLFIVEGLPTCIMSIVAFFYLPDAPETARFLNEDERRIARARVIRQVGHGERTGTVDVKDIVATLLDVKAWIQALMYFSCNVSFSSLPVFLPTILEQMGFSSIDSQGLTAPPYFLSFVVVIVSCIVADRTRQRGLCIFFLSLVGGVGYIVLATVDGVYPRYAGVFLAAAGIFPAISNILAWVLNNQGSDTRRGTGIVILNILGQCGPLLGTRLYPKSAQPRFVKGHYVCAAFMFFNALLAISLRSLLVYENKKRERKSALADGHGDGGGASGMNSSATNGEVSATPMSKVKSAEGVAEENEGPRFRYIL